MGLWRKIFILSFREKSVYRFDYLAGTLFSFLYIILKIYIWKGVYAGSGGAVRGVLLSDMVAYSVLAGFTGGITKTSVMGEFNDSVCSGAISSELLLPVGLKKYLFTRSLARNMFQTVYGILPSVLMAMLLFGIHVRIRYPNLILYLLAAAMGKYICRRIVVLAKGAVLFDGSMEEFRRTYAREEGMDMEDMVRDIYEEVEI